MRSISYLFPIWIWHRYLELELLYLLPYPFSIPNNNGKQYGSPLLNLFWLTNNRLTKTDTEVMIGYRIFNLYEINWWSAQPHLNHKCTQNSSDIERYIIVNWNFGMEPASQSNYIKAQSIGIHYHFFFFHFQCSKQRKITESCTKMKIIWNWLIA